MRLGTGRQAINLKEAVMLELAINRPAGDREAENYPAESALAAEGKIIVDEPAGIHANKNHGGDITPNA